VTYRRIAIECLVRTALTIVITFALAMLPLTFAWESLKRPDVPLGVLWSGQWQELKQALKDIFGASP
jgi:hypothetical protein